MIESNDKQKLRPKWEDLVITVKQIKDKAKETQDKVKKIMGKAAPPPPPPPPNEEKKEEKKEDPKTEKMDEENKPADAAGSAPGSGKV